MRPEGLLSLSYSLTESEAKNWWLYFATIFGIALCRITVAIGNRPEVYNRGVEEIK